MDVPAAVKHPRCRIVHLKDWHFVPRDLFAADIKDQADRPVSEEEVDQFYEEFLLEVELVQIEQKAILRCLIKHHGLRRVLQEGLTRQNLPIYRATLKAMQDVAKEIHGLRREHAKVVGALSEMEEAGKGESADYRRLAEIKEKIEGLLHAQGHTTTREFARSPFRPSDFSRMERK